MVMFILLFWSSLAQATPLTPLEWQGWQKISFDDIPATTVKKKAGVWQFEVKKSSSADIFPLNKPTKIKAIQFEWLSNGTIPTTRPADEKEKDFDDALLRVGLMVAGKAPLIPIFAPAWIKALADLLKHETNQLIYLTPGLKSPPGTSFVSPYSDSIVTRSVASKEMEGGWRFCRVSWDKPLTIVGLWLMADGDNTAQDFTTKLRRLSLIRP